MEPNLLLGDELKTDQLAHKYGVGLPWVYALLRGGRLPATKRDGVWYIRQQDFETYLKSRRTHKNYDFRTARKIPT